MFQVPSSPQTPHTPHTAPPHFKKLIPDWPKWRSVNLKPELFTSHDLGSNPRAPSCQTEHVCSRKTYAGGKGVNIAWIDREVHKIEREKTRLDKEKEKCEKKIQRYLYSIYYKFSQVQCFFIFIYLLIDT